MAIFAMSLMAIEFSFIPLSFDLLAIFIISLMAIGFSLEIYPQFWRIDDSHTTSQTLHLTRTLH
jgi:hypothetical protein